MTRDRTPRCPDQREPRMLDTVRVRPEDQLSQKQKYNDTNKENTKNKKRLLRYTDKIIKKRKEDNGKMMKLLKDNEQLKQTNRDLLATAEDLQKEIKEIATKNTILSDSLDDIKDHIVECHFNIDSAALEELSAILAGVIPQTHHPEMTSL